MKNYNLKVLTGETVEALKAVYDKDLCKKAKEMAEAEIARLKENGVTNPFFVIMDIYHSDGLRKLGAELAIDHMDKYIHKFIYETYPTYQSMYDDLYHQGVLAILENLEAYDPAITKPTYYFSVRMKDLMNKLLNNINGTTKHYTEKNKIVQAAISEFELAGKHYSINDLMVKTGLPYETVFNCLKLYQNNDAEYIDESITSEAMTPEESFLYNEKIGALVDSLNELTDIQKKIVWECVVNRKSYKELSKELDRTLEEIKQIKITAILKLQNSASLNNLGYRVKGNNKKVTSVPVLPLDFVQSMDSIELDDIELSVSFN